MKHSKKTMGISLRNGKEYIILPPPIQTNCTFDFYILSKAQIQS